MNTSIVNLISSGIWWGVPLDGTWNDVRYHYIIQANGKLEQVRNEDEVGRGTRVNNIDVIHIALCGDFTDHEPTIDQYRETSILIGQIRERYGEIPVYKHGELEGEHTSCPMSLDVSKLGSRLTVGKEREKKESEIVKDAGFVLVEPAEIKTQECKAKKWMKCLWLFDEITAYYAPVENQWRYFDPTRDRQRNYYLESIVNGDLTPANGMEYIEEHKFSHGACWYDLLGKRLWIDWRSEKYGVFTCTDRGSAVDHNDIDIRYGIGRDALNRIDGVDDKKKQVIHPWNAMVYEVL